MNNIKLEGKQYTAKVNDDGTITLMPVVTDCDWVPKEDQKNWFVCAWGMSMSWSGDPASSLAFHNIFPDKQQADKASAYMRRNNAIIRACLLVDPEFVPDWSDANQNKYYPVYEHSADRWFVFACAALEKSPAYVSSFEKGKQVIALLTKWGVK